ncbi:NAD-dependent epimerase/dehydratase family protein [Helicobacter sp.]|uniref:NAD-dependent epimerase/dehydratase family protein n=1 Tax=Helicobacter sp. TaxID=218 RepID=UPI0025BE486B|nr:NAD-dependent epimerase/dehydratase family protein [Helicobacter sp.]MCI5969439.1 NAD-dependent epimerase/dehydratase family protein [Helicobacter sp.]MDY2585694.1 NAD-dependent epimerase/dehydratase family protein [Helicobacter sp.]
MKSAIIFGATGYIGTALTQNLLENLIKVLSIGRKNQKDFNTKFKQNSNITYLQINQNFESFFNKISITDYAGSVLYHLAWSGLDRLTNGGIREQIKNISITSQVLSFASKIGCAKFINLSSQEEAIFKHHIKSHQWKNSKYASSPLYYAASKLANAELVRLLSYLQKIDYINIRFSIALDTQLNSPSFVAQTFKKIKNKEAIPQVTNKEPCEIVLLEELVEACYKIVTRQTQGGLLSRQGRHRHSNKLFYKV